MHITKNGLYVYKTKPSKCKQCGSKAIATYYFGHPNTMLFEQAEHNDLIILAGCCIDVTRYTRAWHCNTCEIDFYVENNGLETEQDHENIE